MNYIFDIFLLLVLLLVASISAQKGFVRSIWATVTLIGAFFIAYAFGATVGELICGEFILPRITEYTFEIIKNIVTSTAGNYNVSELFDTLPEEFVILAENCGANIELLEEQFTSAVTIPEEQLYDLASSIALPISNTISKALGIILLFIVSILALALIGLVVKIITKIPVIKTIDGILGFVLGLLKGVVLLFMLCVVAAIFVESEFMSGAPEMFFKSLTENSYIFRFFCAFSPIDFINVG